MAGVRGRRDEAAPAQTQEIIRAHEPQHALVIDRPALTPQQRVEPAVAVVPVADGHSLEYIPQLGLFAARGDLMPVPIVAELLRQHREC